MTLQIFSYRKFRKNLSFLLLAVFTVSLLISSGHYHSDSHIFSNLSYQSGYSNSHDKADTCPICQFILQIQSSDLYAPLYYAVSIPYNTPLPDFSSYNQNVIATHSSRAPPLA